MLAARGAERSLPTAQLSAIHSTLERCAHCAGCTRACCCRLTGARFVLVVEKDAVFQHLVQDRLWEQLPCVLLTGRGMPDMASRALLAALVAGGNGGGGGGAGGFDGSAGSDAAGSFGWSQQHLQQQQSQRQRATTLPVLGLVDWNPSGVAILLAYKHGTAGLGLEAGRCVVIAAVHGAGACSARLPSHPCRMQQSARMAVRLAAGVLMSACMHALLLTAAMPRSYAVPSLAWLGVHADMLGDAPASSLQPLSRRDEAMLASLRVRLAGCPAWQAELAEMGDAGVKADIEALYGLLPGGQGGLARELARRALAGQYLR